MGQDASGGVVTKGGFDNFTAVDTTAIDGAPKQFLELYNTVTIVQPEDREHLMFQMGQPEFQQIP